MDERMREGARRTVRGNRAGKPTGGGLPDEVVSVVVLLLLACAFQLGGMGDTEATAMALLILIAGGISMIYLRIDPHLVRLAHGWAFVRNRRAPDGSRIRVLRSGGVYQSATYLDERRFTPVFAYQRSFDALFAADGAYRERTGRDLAHVLALGGGGYAWPKHALTEHPELQMDVVEIDPAVTRAAQRWFFVDELQVLAGDRLRLVTADGRAFLDEAAGAGTLYDAIVNDTFCGCEPVRALATAEAVGAVKTCLAPGGLYLTNVVSRDGGTDVSFLRDVVATLAASFRHVWVLPASDEDLGGEDNYLVVASDASYGYPDAISYDEEFLGAVLHDA